MQGDKVCFNGIIGVFGEFPSDVEALFSSNYIYQQIHTLGHRPLHLAAHLEIAERSYQKLYGGDPALNEETVYGEIEETLAANRYPHISNLVTLYLFPPAKPEGTPVRLVVCTEPMLYKGYVLWHTRPRAVLRAYDYLGAGHSTALARISHRHVANDVRNEGFDVAVRSLQGWLMDAEGWPLFAVRNGRAFTTPLSAGATDSVPRRIGYRLCEMAGVECEGEEVAAAELSLYDELFYVTPQGIVSLLSCNEHLLYNLATLRIAAVMERMDLAEYDTLL